MNDLGPVKIDDENKIRKNLYMIFGTAPGELIVAKTSMCKEIADVFNTRYDKSFFVLTIPNCFKYLACKDASFEVVTTGSIQSTRLHYNKNVITHKIGLIFNNNPFYFDAFVKPSELMGMWRKAYKFVEDETRTAQKLLDLLKFTDV